MHTEREMSRRVNRVPSKRGAGEKGITFLVKNIT